MRKKVINVESANSNIRIVLHFLEYEDLSPLHRIRSILAEIRGEVRYVEFPAYYDVNEYVEVSGMSVCIPLLYLGGSFCVDEKIYLQIELYCKSLVEVSILADDISYYPKYLPLLISAPTATTPQAEIRHVDLFSMLRVSEKKENHTVSYIISPVSGFAICVIC